MVNDGKVSQDQLDKLEDDLVPPAPARAGQDKAPQPEKK
jgi:hypothetical protein